MNILYLHGLKSNLSSKKRKILGNPEEVDSKETLAFLGTHLQEHELEIKVDSHLGHRIPLELFQEQISDFFSKICY